MLPEYVLCKFPYFLSQNIRKYRLPLSVGHCGQMNDLPIKKCC